MKIALTYDVKNKRVYDHFGDCENFLIVDLDNNKKEIIDNGGYSHKDLIPYLSSFDIKTIICGGIGSMAVQLFNEKEISVICGIDGDVDEVIELFKEQKLVSNDSMIHQCSCH